MKEEFESLNGSALVEVGNGPDVADVGVVPTPRSCLRDEGDPPIERGPSGLVLRVRCCREVPCRSAAAISCAPSFCPSPLVFTCSCGGAEACAGGAGFGSNAPRPSVDRRILESGTSAPEGSGFLGIVFLGLSLLIGFGDTRVSSEGSCKWT